MSAPIDQYRFDDVIVEVSSFRVRKGEQSVVLTPRAFDVLLVLLRNSGRVVEKQRLFDEVWKDTFVSDNALTKVIKEIRQALNDDAGRPSYVETLPKRGYRFIAELQTDSLTETESVHSRPGMAIEPSTPPVASRRKLILAASLIGLVMVLVGLSAVLKLTSPTTNNEMAIDSIAVLPFVNESGAENLDYLSDGVTESLINSLSQLPRFSVKARSTVYRYKNKNLSPQQAGSELNVKAVLTGRILQRGDDLVLYLSLVDVRSGDQVWGDQYNRKPADLLTLQSDIARDVSNKLRLRLSGTDELKVTRSYKNNSEAYRAYLQGRFHWNKRTPKDLQKSVEYFQQAVNADRNYALAFAGLADAYSQLSNYGGAQPRQAMPKAKEAVLKALSLDETLAEAHTAHGFILMIYDFDFAGSEREYRRSLELNPNYPTTHLYYAELLMYLGRQEEAAAEYQRALEIDPLSLIVNRMYGESLLYARKYDESIAQIKKTLDLDAGFASAHYSLFAAYQLQGKYAEGVAEFAKSQELIGEEKNAAAARESFARGGWNEYLRRMTAKSGSLNLPGYSRAVFHAALGEKAKAINQLEQGYEAREHFLIWLKVDPRLDPLRGEPRFDELVKRVGL